MSIIDAIILGIIQGLTEFLPVSSSGHIELGAVLLHLNVKNNLLFSVVVHAATALSTIIVFRKDIVRIILDVFLFEWNEGTVFAVKILISIIPVGIVGLLFEKKLEPFFEGNAVLVGFMLIITSLFLSLTGLRIKQKGDVTFLKSIIIGAAQAVAILPGISRSGATIATSLLLGVKRPKAARFSFLMVLIPIFGAVFLKMKDYIQSPDLYPAISVSALLFGFIAAFLSGLVACRWMLDIVKKGKLIWFAIYCFIVGIIAVTVGS
ncbi:MAG: undecaprenyl-diphosphate phosphatase [Cytophagales bacterium]|nr:undecaprenyl-diphosphate phosphatase [Cytophagales bacterium]